MSFHVIYFCTCERFLNVHLNLAFVIVTFLNDLLWPDCNTSLIVTCFPLI